MTIGDLRERVAGHARGAMIPREWILEQLDEIPEAALSGLDWLTVHEAADVTGEPLEWLRRRAPGWASFSRPQIRVRKMNQEKLRSHWLFAEEDCLRYRDNQEESSGPRIVPDDPDDIEGIKAHYREKVTANL